MDPAGFTVASRMACSRQWWGYRLSMRLALALVVALGCGGPSHDQLVETNAATMRRPATQAPPASTSDRDRERLNQQFEDMETTQQAYREAGDSNQAPPKAAQPIPGQPAPPRGKKGVAEQAPPETPPQKKGVAEQAPSE